MIRNSADNVNVSRFVTIGEHLDHNMRLCDVAGTSKKPKHGEEQQKKTTDSMRIGPESGRIMKQFSAITTLARVILDWPQNGVLPRKANSIQTILRPSFRSRLTVRASGVRLLSPDM